MNNINTFIIPNPYQAKKVREIAGYILKDNRTGAIVGKYGPDQGKRARTRANKLDLEYGAIRYSVQPVYKEI